MKKSETRSTPKPKRRKMFDVEKFKTIANGLGGELTPFACDLVGFYVKDAKSRVTVAMAVEDFTADFMTINVLALPKDPTERRAALVRFAANAIALLALDELERGSSVVECEMVRLDEHGYPDSRYS